MPMTDAATRALCDDELVALVRGGDHDAFAALIGRHKRRVYGLAYRLLGNATDAEDAAQETFVRAYARLDRYEPNRRFGAWIGTVCSHWCIDFMRARGRRPQTVALGKVPESDRFIRACDEITFTSLTPSTSVLSTFSTQDVKVIPSQVLSQIDGPEEGALGSDARDEVQRWLDALPPRYRAVLVLRYFHDLSYAEIADTLGEPVSTVRMRLFRARNLLHDVVQQEQRAHEAAFPPARTLPGLRLA